MAEGRPPGASVLFTLLARTEIVPLATRPHHSYRRA